MTTNLFSDWLAEVAAEAVVVNSDDIVAEARVNQWSFSLSPEQRAVVTIDDVVAFAVGVANGRRAWLEVHGIGPMVLYWWHDAQAGQLRFSLVSASHGRLPFGCEIVAAASVEEIVAEWLASPFLDGIPWDDLHPQTADDEASQPIPAALLVWSQRVP